MEEVTYLQAPGTLVTSSRIEIQGQTFAVRNVGSVKVVPKPRKWIGGAFVLLVGVSALAGNAGVGAALIAVGAWLLYAGAPRYSLVLVAGGGETTAVSSRDAGQVEAMRAAVAQAISAR